MHWENIMDIMHTDMDEIAVIKINQRPSRHCIEPKGKIKKITGWITQRFQRYTGFGVAE